MEITTLPTNFNAFLHSWVEGKTITCLVDGKEQQMEIINIERHCDGEFTVLGVLDNEQETKCTIMITLKPRANNDYFYRIKSIGMSTTPMQSKIVKRHYIH